MWVWHCRVPGRVLSRLGVWMSRLVLLVVCVCVGQVLRPPAGRLVGVGGGCLGFWVGLRFAGGGGLLVGKDGRQGLQLRGQ